MKVLLKQFLSSSILICTCLALMGGCLPVQDRPAKKQQVKNTAKTFVQGYFLKRVEQAKDDIDATYKKMLALQDSIDKAGYNVVTLQDLKASRINEEVLQLEALKGDMISYVDYPAENPYPLRFEQIIGSTDVSSGSDELYRMLNSMRLGQTLPADYLAMKQEEQYRQQFLYALNEYVDKRLLTASQIYRKWAETYRQKALELTQSVIKEKKFSMTDLERIETQRIAEKYMGYSIEFIEKSDSLFAIAKESSNNIQKIVAEKKIKQHLRLQELAAK